MQEPLFVNLFCSVVFLLFQSSLKFGHSMCNGPGVLLLARLRGSIFCTFTFVIVSVRLLWMFFLDLPTLTLVLYLLSIALFFLLGVLRIGGFSARHGSLSLGCSSGLTISPVSAISPKLVYTFLLSENLSTPHCVVTFAPIFGPLYWSCTWRQLFLFDMDRPVIDLAWKIAHGVLYTADRLASFGYSLQLSCFCNSASETIDHLFFECPLAQSVLSWLQSLMFRWSSVVSSLVVCHVRFGFNVDEFSNIPRVFIYILNVCKFFLWVARNDFRFHNTRPSAIDVLANVRGRVRFHLPTFFKRFRSARRRRFFIRQWGACNVVASLVNNHLLVHV